MGKRFGEAICRAQFAWEAPLCTEDQRRGRESGVQRINAWFGREEVLCEVSGVRSLCGAECLCGRTWGGQGIWGGVALSLPLKSHGDAIMYSFIWCRRWNSLLQELMGNRHLTCKRG